MTRKIGKRKLLRDLRRIEREFRAVAAVAAEAHFLVRTLDAEDVALGGESGRRLQLLRKELRIAAAKMRRVRRD